MKKVGLIVMISLLVAACSSHYASNGEQQYLKSRNGPPLLVPELMTTANISHFYDLPPQNQNARISITPPVV